METTTETTVQNTPGWTDVAAASDDAEARRKLEERFPTKKVTKLVEVPLTDAQIADKGRVLAGLEKEITDAKSLLKEECARLRADVKELETKRATIAAEIENGKGKVEVACVQRLVFETNSLQTVREDDGIIVEERALSASERQLSLLDETPVENEIDDPAALLEMAEEAVEEDGDASEEDEESDGGEG